MNKERTKIIVDYIKDKKIIPESDFKQFLGGLFPDMNGQTYYLLLMNLYKANILYRYNSSLLKPCNERVEYRCSPIFDDKLKETLTKINPPIISSGWSIGEISRFMSLQLMNEYYFIETYFYASETVLNALLDLNLNVIYEKDYSINSKYLRNNAVYIIRIINEDSPIVRPNRQIRTNDYSFLTVPKIEKIIVDIIIDDFFDTLLGDERIEILKSLLSKYRVNFATILRYAKKKYKVDKVITFIEQTGFNINNGEFE